MKHSAPDVEAEDEELWTKTDVSAFLKVGEYTIEEMARAGHLPSHKIGRSRRYSPSEVKRWALSRRH